MILARPRGFFSRTSDLVDGDGTVYGWIRQGFIWGGGSMMVGQFPYTISRAGVGGWRVEHEGAPGAVVQATRTRLFRVRYEVTWEGGALSVQRVGFGFAIDLLRDGVEVGRLAPTHVFSKTWSGGIPDDVPPVARAFVLWLVERLRRTSVAAAAGGGA